MTLENHYRLLLPILIDELLLEILAPQRSIKWHFDTNILLNIPVNIRLTFQHAILVDDKCLLPRLFNAHLFVVIVAGEFYNLVLEFRHGFESSLYVELDDFRIDFLRITSTIHLSLIHI